MSVGFDKVSGDRNICSQHPTTPAQFANHESAHMNRSNRLFEIIQIFRAARRPLTAVDLAEKLEVSTRTIYRDIVALQSMQVPIEGEAGIGYMMRRGYDLPPLNFDLEEVEALRVGLAMLVRTGDSALQRAAQRVHGKIEALHGPADWLQVAPWGAPSDNPDQGCVSIAMLRAAIRDEQKIHITYGPGDAPACDQIARTVRPIALVYHVECVMVAAWCELRGAFRHFRTDRIHQCTVIDQYFIAQGATLRALWQDQESTIPTQVPP